MTQLQMKWIGASVHLLTASGGICALFALHHVAQRDWQAVFAWLGLALFIDGIDGWLARWSTVAKILPRFSGERLDLIVDYLNYVVVPAFVILESGRLGSGAGELGACLMILSSLYHFADQSSKTSDGYFIGFPALWNVVIFYLFVIPVPEGGAFLLIVLLCGLVFVPLKWAHSFRVATLKLPVAILTAAWAFASLYAILNGFPSAIAIQIILLIAAIGYITIGLWRTLWTDELESGR